MDPITKSDRLQVSRPILQQHNSTVNYRQMKLRMNRRFKFFAIAGFILIIPLGLWKLSNSRSFQIAGELISDFQLADSLIALTFDDGPSAKYTDEILTILDHYNVKATFFVTGREVEEFPNEARKIVEAGHQLGNHSPAHLVEPRRDPPAPGLVHPRPRPQGRSLQERRHGGWILSCPGGLRVRTRWAGNF